VVYRLDALLVVLKTCKTSSCIHPWSSHHPSTEVETLLQALDPQYDNYYKTYPKVGFSSCELGYIPQAEGNVDEIHFASAGVDWDVAAVGNSPARKGQEPFRYRGSWSDWVWFFNLFTTTAKKGISDFKGWGGGNVHRGLNCWKINISLKMKKKLNWSYSCGISNTTFTISKYNVFLLQTAFPYLDDVPLLHELFAKHVSLWQQSIYHDCNRKQTISDLRTLTIRKKMHKKTWRKPQTRAKNTNEAKQSINGRKKENV
jgi:hypothetical protein